MRVVKSGEWCCCLAALLVLVQLLLLGCAAGESAAAARTGWNEAERDQAGRKGPVLELDGKEADKDPYHVADDTGDHEGVPAQEANTKMVVAL